jgi:hypothetical protein
LYLTIHLGFINNFIQNVKICMYTVCNLFLEPVLHCFIFTSFETPEVFFFITYVIPETSTLENRTSMW